MGGGEGEDEIGVVTSIDEEVGGVHGEAILVAMPVRRAAQRRTSFVWTARPLRLDRSFRWTLPDLGPFVWTLKAMAGAPVAPFS